MRSHVLWEGEFISSNAPHKAKCVLGFQRYTRQLRSSLFSNLCWEGHLFWMQNIYHGYSGVSWNLVHQSRCSERLSTVAMGIGQLLQARTVFSKLYDAPDHKTHLGLEEEKRKKQI